MSKVLIGTVSSVKGDKTIVVTVSSSRTHPIYKKQYSVSNKIMAHDEKNECLVGDVVQISETRPISRRKSFRLTKVIQRPAIRAEERIEALQPAKIESEKPVKDKTEREKPVKEASTKLSSGEAK